MTNQPPTSPNPNSQELNLKRVEALVEASPFRDLLRLPPEEVLEMFRSKAGLALLEGISELQRRELGGLMSSTLKHADVVDKFFEVRGIDSVCAQLLQLPKKVDDYVKAQRRAKEK